jgi:hypothetical protein
MKTASKFIRRPVSEYEELEQEVNSFMVSEGVMYVTATQYEVSGGYIFAFITYVGV